MPSPELLPLGGWSFASNSQLLSWVAVKTSLSHCLGRNYNSQLSNLHRQPFPKSEEERVVSQLVPAKAHLCYSWGLQGGSLSNTRTAGERKPRINTLHSRIWGILLWIQLVLRAKKIWLLKRTRIFSLCITTTYKYICVCIHIHVCNEPFPFLPYLRGNSEIIFTLIAIATVSPIFIFGIEFYFSILIICETASNLSYRDGA